jgi:hypothetical protein
MRWRHALHVTIVALVALLLWSVWSSLGGNRHLALRGVPTATETETEMETRPVMPLHIKLRDGFQQDTVSIQVDGLTVYYGRQVQTDLSISFADAVEVPVTDAVVRVRVEVQGGPAAEQDIRVAETPFLDIRRVNGQLQLHTSADEMPML